MANPYAVVDDFERAVADFAGAPYAVAVDCCTNAIFLCLEWAKYLDIEVNGRQSFGTVVLPARTYCSVPMAVIHAGFKVAFEDVKWRGVYQLSPYVLYDGAKRFRRGMYKCGLHCLSFHAKKLLAIGRGGMILTDDINARDWLRRARYDGRSGRPYDREEISMLGWHMYMTPEQAARGLQLLDALPPDMPDQTEDYPDLRQFEVFRGYAG